jgi:hypothetical protein
MKLKWGVIALVVAAVVSVPLWGGCDVNAKVCSAWCNVRHVNSDVKAAGCRARCQTDKLACIARQGTQGLDDFFEGFKR